MPVKPSFMRFTLSVAASLSPYCSANSSVAEYLIAGGASPPSESVTLR